MERPTRTDRRGFLTRAAGVGTLAGLAGCLGLGGGSGGEGYGDHFADVEDAGEPVDATGEAAVTVAVGAGDGFDFDPIKMDVSPGTTITWEWTGNGGQHVVDFEDRNWESSYSKRAGHTYERTVQQAGYYKYFCEPHLSLGMKGGFRVVE
ncbi:plastocyanin/azurin family copper-binding protein [Haloglomus litoreum]|uniref:plastocyanin/azurin family copper-binding protein n=1 Tax=Haloglomus litoreum TaxID=3034026 RepID=UPI0023E8693F|nr:plastocyanin/azurin family copper-binding protein [Haloglomus sp. DT116]